MRDDAVPERELTRADEVAAERGKAEEGSEATRLSPGDREVSVPRETRAVDLSDDDGATPLVSSDVAQGLRARWTQIQASFVDEPRRAVEQADVLVADAIQRLSESFAGARATLEQEWDRGGDLSTEDLRRALQRYRAFFGRLLQV